MARIELLIKAIDKALIEKGKNYMTLGQANKSLYENGHITEFEKQSGFLKKMLEDGLIKNAKQTESSPKQWRLFLSDKRLKPKRAVRTKKVIDEYETEVKFKPKEKFAPKYINLKDQHKSNTDNIPWKWIIGGIIALIFVIGLFSDDNNGTGNSDPILAYNYAKDFIKDRLKSPSTAEFPGTFEKKNHVRDLGNGQYQISSWVDSQNGFGAKIRSRWSCKITFKNEQVHAENIVIY